MSYIYIYIYMTLIA